MRLGLRGLGGLEGSLQLFGVQGVQFLKQPSGFDIKASSGFRGLVLCQVMQGIRALQEVVPEMSWVRVSVALQAWTNNPRPRPLLWAGPPS